MSSDRSAAERPHIILTETDAAVREALTDLLSSEGYTVAAVADIAATRDELRRNPFSVLLLDARFGDNAHGLEWLLDFVRNEGAPRIIIVSGSNDASTLGERFGVTVIRKPFDIDTLMAAIVSVTLSNIRARDRSSPV
jgi:DNA-binding response OmpR family regulator